MEYSCIRIDPKTAPVAALAQNYKSLRLSALTESPTSFSSTHDLESQFTSETWESRLCQPGRETFVCCYHASGTSPLDGDWVGQVTIHGPISSAMYKLPEDAQQPEIVPDDEEEKWQMLSLFTLSSHRGKGLGKKLCRETFEWLRKRKSAESNQQTSRVRVRIMIKPENTATYNLYRTLGFTAAGSCTLAEALRANGDADMVPQNGGGSKYNDRTGLIMVTVLEKVP